MESRIELIEPPPAPSSPWLAFSLGPPRTPLTREQFYREVGRLDLEAAIGQRRRERRRMIGLGVLLMLTLPALFVLPLVLFVLAGLSDLDLAHHALDAVLESLDLTTHGSGGRAVFAFFGTLVLTIVGVAVAIAGWSLEQDPTSVEERRALAEEHNRMLQNP